MSFALTVGVLLLWLLHGIGLVQWLAPNLRQPTLLGWIMAMWLGLVVELVVLVNAYFLIPGCTIGAIAWPVTLVLAAGSLALYVRTPRPKLQFDIATAIVLALSLIATMLVLRPLLGHLELGFYYSNNGEFSNYAAMSDVVQFTDSSARVGGPLDIESREAVAGIVAALISALTGKAALWTIQPVAAAFAALAFMSLGLLFALVAAKLRPLASVPVWLVYAWAILSASSQCFWTLSFVSQYLNIALFCGGLLFLAHARELCRPRRMAVLGTLIGAFAFVYPEMVVPTAGLLCAFELACNGPNLRERGRAFVWLLLAIAIAVVVANRLGFILVVQRGGAGSGGWDIYGPHRPVLGFVASLAGFTNTFAAPAPRHPVWSVITVVLIAGALVHIALRVWREPDPVVRGLLHLGWLFWLGVAAGFWLIVSRALPTNYVALKLILGFDWLAYLSIALLFARLIAWHARLWPVLALIMAFVLAGLWTPAVQFTKLQHRARRKGLFLESEAATCRAQLAGRRAYVSATWFNYAIIGQFIAHDRDLVAVNGHWPNGDGQELDPRQSIVLLGDNPKLADDPRVTATYHVQCQGRRFVLLAPD